MLVLDHHLQEAAQLSLLLFEVGIQQTLVALTSAPQHVVLAAKTFRQFDAVPHLCCRKSKHIRIRVGSRSRHVARVAEEIRRTPKQLHSRSEEHTSELQS